jgi:hypothetical protein
MFRVNRNPGLIALCHTFTYILQSFFHFCPVTVPSPFGGHRSITFLNVTHKKKDTQY